MAAQALEELREFHRFLTAKLGSSGIDLSPEEALDEWRQLHPDTKSFDEEIAAIQEALADKANGDQGIPFEDFDRDFRKRHDLPAQP